MQIFMNIQVINPPKACMFKIINKLQVFNLTGLFLKIRKD